jgi:hypothetical protein
MSRTKLFFQAKNDEEKCFQAEAAESRPTSRYKLKKIVGKQKQVKERYYQQKQVEERCFKQKQAAERSARRSKLKKG